MILELILIFETLILSLLTSMTNAFTILKAKLKKDKLGIIDNGRTIEFVPLKKKGMFLEEDVKKNKRIWLLVSPNHLKYDPKLRLEVVWLSSQRAISMNDELAAIIKKAWKDNINDQKELLAEFVEEWEQDEDGHVFPVKFKENLVVDGVSVSQEHVKEVIKFFEPKLLYSYIENETTARVLSRTYGFDVKTFLSAFIGVLLAIMIAYYLIQSNAIDTGAIANAVKHAVTNVPANATVIRG